MKRVLAFFPALLVILFIMPSVKAAHRDIPDNSLGKEVRKAIEYGLMNGYSESVFGYSDPMTRIQFVSALDRMLPSDANSVPLPETMALTNTLSPVHRDALIHAVARGAVDASVPFRSDSAITRGEMAEILVRMLGLQNAALSLASNSHNALSPFTDLPEGKEGYISIAYAIGMTKGTSETLFSPNLTATRAQAAAMLVRIYEKLHKEIDFRHGFFPASGSKTDIAAHMNVISVEWGRMTWTNATPLLSTSSAHGNTYYVPADYPDILQDFTDSNTRIYFSVFMDASGGVAELLDSRTGRKQAVQEILSQMDNPLYSGVTIRFEGLGIGQQDNFVAFLSDLKNALASTGKRGLYVCTYDGYDHRRIAEIADKIILMAHNYDAEQLNNFLGTKVYEYEAPASLSDVYLSLFHLLETVPDSSKLLLGLSFYNAAWQLNQKEQLISGIPVFLDAKTLEERLSQSGTSLHWSVAYQMPYAIYNTQEGGRYFIWYENSSSIEKKMELVKLFGITGVSYWHLGLVPFGFSF